MMQALLNRVPPRLLAVLAWLAPVLFTLWVHWNALQCWFTQDDFAWLGLLRQVHSPGDLLHALFDPAAQGTIRPWSERGLFLLLEYLFGIEDVPFRIVTFVVMSANLAMLAWIVRRVTGSLLAGAVAGVVWTANTALMTVMSWSSSFNEALCPFFLLAALILFIRYIDTGRRLWWWLQLVVFTLGFGALESNIVYPALACSWILFIAPPERRTSLLRALIVPSLISVAYFFVHRTLVPFPHTGVYALHVDSRIFGTLALYLKWSLLPADFPAFGHSATQGILILTICAAAIAVCYARELFSQRRTVLFFAAWFLLTLAPVLPLPDHRIDYYLTIPLIGLAMLAGYAFSRWPPIATSVLAVYLLGMVPLTRAADTWALRRSDRVRMLVEGVEQGHEAHPSKIILLDGITTDLYDSAFAHSPFFPFGIDNVYLTPGSELNIQPVSGNTGLHEAVLEPAVTLSAIRRGDVVIYSVSGNHLRNITAEYERSAPKLLASRLPDHVDVGSDLFSDFLGPEWLPQESGFRWMPARATLKLRGPGPNGGFLTIDGYCPAQQLQQAPRRLWVMVDGLPVGETKIVDPEINFHRLFPLPAATWGRDSMEVELRVDPVDSRDGRQYGLVFGKVAVTDNAVPDASGPGASKPGALKPGALKQR